VYYSVLQCVVHCVAENFWFHAQMATIKPRPDEGAVCRSVLQCIAAWCSGYHQASTRRSCVKSVPTYPRYTMHAATHCNTLQHTATHCTILCEHTCDIQCITLQHTAPYCNTLQRCNTLQLTRDIQCSRTYKPFPTHTASRWTQVCVGCENMHTIPYCRTKTSFWHPSHASPRLDAGGCRV